MMRFTSLVLLASATGESLPVAFDDTAEGHLSLLQLRQVPVPAGQVEDKLLAGIEQARASVAASGKMGMGKMGMGKMGMGKMGMGKMGMGKMGMGKMGMGMGGKVPAVEVDPVVEEEAAAVGDPHIHQMGGANADLCCKDGHCEPCQSSLLSQDPELDMDADEEMLEDEMLDPALDMDMEGDMDMFGKGKMGMGKMGMGKMGMGKMGMGKMGMGGKVPVEPEIEVDPEVEEEAAAVGDPHMSQSNGGKSDLCCEGGSCKPCPIDMSFSQASHTKSAKLEESLHRGLEEARDAMEQDPLDMDMDMDPDMDMFGKTRGKMGKMGMGKMGMGKMGMGKMGMGGKVPVEPEIEVDPDVDEEAAAVGDPHMQRMGGETSDLEPSDLSLISQKHSKLDEPLLDDEGLPADEDLEMFGKMGMGKMGMGKMGMGKMGMGKMGMGKMGMGKMGMGGKKPVEPEIAVDPVVEEEAAAVGDPHMTQMGGAKADLCCTGGYCEPCPAA